ncbi:MAG: hypothetical protein FJ090_10500 [Deltaproteobacteria bacterium]|nr:hypothetical protein [Deltaproteobacteria bacterium]
MFAPLLVAAVSCTARAEEVAAVPPASRLEEAIRLYAQGETASSRSLLQALVAVGPELPAEVRQAALAYLGDVLYSEEGPQASRPMFDALLEEAPDFVMDPFEHPEEVCRYFEALREEARVPVIERPLPERGPPPYWSLVPGGLHWYARGKIGTGLAVTVAQAGLLATNIALYQTLVSRGQIPRQDPAALADYDAHRLGTNIAAGAFYLSLLLPPAIEFSRWSAQPSRVGVGVGPGSLLVSGQF